MSYTVENLEKSMAKITITVDADAFEEAMVKSYNKNKKNISIQGFRKGKAPRKMVEKLYGPEVFYEDAANFAIPDAYEEAAKESGLEIVSRPEIDVVEIEKGKDFVFTATVAVKPEVTLGDYKGIEVEKKTVKVMAADVNAEIDKVREQNSRMITVENRGIKKDDTAVIDFEGFVDGEPFQGGKGEDYSLVIGSHSFIDTFEDQLVGKKAGEEVDVNVTFPEEYHEASLKGKPALFKVTVKEIKKKELPKLDDEFASEVSEFETLKEYKASVKKNLTERRKEEAKREKENEVVEKVQKAISTPLPELGDIHRGYTHPIYQVIPYDTNDERLKEIKELMPHCKETQWNPQAVDIIPATGGKQNGIHEVLKYYSIDQSETMSFGDGKNDIDMFEYTKISVAMGNADDDVKKASDYVTDDIDEDGLYNALKHFEII